MKRFHTILMALALVGVGVGLLGCRSTRRSPTTTAPSAATTPAPAAVQPAPPAPSLPPAPPPSWAMGGPDGPEVFPPTSADGFEPDPVALDVVPDVSAEIAAEREARQRAEQALVALRDEVQRLNESLAEPPAAPAPAAAAPGAPPGEARAERFARTLRQRTSGEVERNGSVVIVRMSDAFEPGSERLKSDPSLRTTLLATAAALLQSPEAQVAVVGHTDSDPISRSTWEGNDHLSRARASTVAQALSEHGVPAGRIAVDGRGSAEPLVFPEQGAADKARNRRVEVHVRF